MSRLPGSPISQGIGSVTGGFEGPSVGITSVSPVFQPEQTAEEKLAAAFGLIGQGAASALSAQADQALRLERLKNVAEQQTARDNARLMAMDEAARMSRAKREVQAALVEADGRGLAWLETTSRVRAANSSGSAAEIWARVHQGAANSLAQQQAAAEGEADARLKQEYSLASREAHNVIGQLGLALAEDPELRRELIGDGRGMAKRVEDWVLGEVASIMPQVLIADPADEQRVYQRNMLIAALKSQAEPLTRSLMAERLGQVQEAREIHASREMDASLFDVLKGNTDPETWVKQTQFQWRENLGHKTEPQKREALRRQVVQAAEEMSSGAWGIPFAQGVDTLKGLMTAAFNEFGPLFSESEQASLLSRMYQKAERHAQRVWEDELSKKRQSFMTTQVLPNGSVAHLPDPMAALRMTMADPDSGVSPIQEAYLNTVARLGLDHGTDHLETNVLLGSLQESMVRASNVSSAEFTRTQQQIGNLVSVFSGDRGADPEAAYDAMPHRHLYGSTQTPWIHPDIQNSLVEDLRERATLRGMDFTEMEMQIRSGNIPRTPETRDLRGLLAEDEALRWNAPEAAEEYGLPKKLIGDKATDLRSGDPERHFEVVRFATQLSARQREILYDGLGETEQAALRYAVMRETIGLQDSVRPSLDELSAGITDMLSRPTLSDWRRQVSVFGESRHDTNARVMAATLTKAFRAEGARDIPSVSSEKQDEQLEAGLRLAFHNDASNKLRFVSSLWKQIEENNPGMPPEQVGAIVMTQIQREGYRFVGLQSRKQTRMVFDPVGHLGPQGSTVENLVNQTVGTPLPAELRGIIAEAMGYDPMQTPVTMGDWFRREYPDHLKDTADENIPWDYSQGLAMSGEMAMRRPAAGMGGLLLQVAMPNSGVMLPPIRSRHRVSVSTPEGSIDIPAGTPISAISALMNYRQDLDRIESFRKPRHVFNIPRGSIR